MVRFAIIGVVVGVALVLYALVDAAMSDPSRARGVSKPVWVVLIVVLPIIGAILWFVIGKGRGPAPVAARAPDDDPHFSGTRYSPEEIDAHVAELEARLRELDSEVFPEAEGGRLGADRPAPGGAESKSADPKNSEPKSGEPRAAEPRGAEQNGGIAKPDGDAAGEQR